MRYSPGTLSAGPIAGWGQLSVGDEWVLLGRLPGDLSAGDLHVRLVSENMKRGKVQFAPLD